jgi:cyclic 2,3-diphosphoglycerate synthetase
VIRSAIAETHPDLHVVATTFRPAPIEPVAGRRVFFATTAPAQMLPLLTQFLETEYGCEVVGASPHLSDRIQLREDMRAASGTFDMLLTELKAAAIDVVAAAGEESGVPTVLCDNVPVAVDGSDLGAMVDTIAAVAIERGRVREGGTA